MAIVPDFGGEDEDGQAEEASQCLATALRIAGRALHEAGKRMNAPRPPEWAIDEGAVPSVVVRIREIARSLGWSVGIHGSMVRDIDLIAVPWTKEAAPWQEFHAAIIAGVPLWDAEGTALGQHLGPFGRIKALALQPGCEKDGDHPKGKWKPPCIDLSIVDPRCLSAAAIGTGGQWISVKERMPEPKRYVLAWCPSRQMAFQAVFGESVWTDIGGHRLYEEVTHWMTTPVLPSPPSQRGGAV